MNVLSILLTFVFRWRLLDFGLSWKWRMYAAVCLLLVLMSLNASWKYRMYAAVCLLLVLMSFNASWKLRMYAASCLYFLRWLHGGQICLRPRLCLGLQQLIACSLRKQHVQGSVQTSYSELLSELCGMMSHDLSFPLVRAAALPRQYCVRLNSFNEMVQTILLLIVMFIRPHVGLATRPRVRSPRPRLCLGSHCVRHKSSNETISVWLSFILWSKMHFGFHNNLELMSH